MVYYQPKYNVQVDPPVIESAEALVRWKHHEIGMIPPGKFIELFEKHGQIGLVDRFVWQETARQISEWKKKHGVAIPISVNISRVDFFDPSLVKTLEGIVAQNGLDRKELHLEVTESAYTDDTDQLIGTVKKLRDMGYVIEMDDFGTGYSSLHMLSSVPVDILKLDKSFVDKLAEAQVREEDVRLVELILDIARNLNLAVVAEGVEKEEQLEFLKSRGCEMIQGYYFSPALPANVFEELVF
jgi:EAL domain-containing protein (putative c-di-GMP-specific phosphodiesterase class I)